MPPMLNCIYAKSSKDNKTKFNSMDLKQACTNLGLFDTYKKVKDEDANDQPSMPQPPPAA